MKKIIITPLLLLLTGLSIQAQQFIDKATIEYEVKSNVKKTMGEGFWAEMMQDQLPNFKIAYYNFTFANGKSMYKFDRFDPSTKIPEFLKRGDEDSEYYTDHNTGEMSFKKDVFGNPFFIKDSLRTIEWRYTNESRVIAGFNCRKAIGRIYDSVYVFVFYTDEITISGGPCSISGLPGMIMGMTIPRLYTSWIATKVNLNNVNESIIKPVTAKKPSTYKEYRNLLVERTKEWGGEDEENKKWLNQFLWSAML
jgi:GLPGLI family protein